MDGGGWGWGGVFDTFATLVDLVYDVTDTAAGHKMTALTVAFSRLSNVDFFRKIKSKNCRVSTSFHSYHYFIFIPFLSIFHSIPVNKDFFGSGPL